MTLMLTEESQEEEHENLFFQVDIGDTVLVLISLQKEYVTSYVKHPLCLA